MEDRQREHIGRITAQYFASSRAALGMEFEKVLSEFGLAGRTGGGMTMVAAGQRLSRATEILVGELAVKIASISRTPAAFEELASASRRWLRIGRDDLRHLAERAAGPRLQGPSTLLSLADTEIEKVQAMVDLRLAVEEMEFSAPPTASVSAPAPRQKKGGRLPAEFWDDMWAATATSLYAGTLQPKSQADVVRAMTEWIEASGNNAAESTIKARARRLWDRLQALDD